MKIVLKNTLKVLLAVMMFSTLSGVNNSIHAEVNEDYPLWIGGKQVNSNYLSGEGWEYDPQYNILTLNGVNITTGYVDGFDTYGIYYEGSKDLTIELAENSVNTIGGDASQITNGIYSSNSDSLEEADITILGSGSLTIIIEADSAAGIRVFGNLEISGDSTLITTVSGEFSVGVCTEKDMIIDGSIVTAIVSGDSTVAINTDNIVIKNKSTVTATSSGDYSEGISAYDVYDQTTQTPGEVSIIDSTVTAKGLGENSYGINTLADGTVFIDSDSIVNVTGDESAIIGLVKNDIAGTGWTNTQATEGKASILEKPDGQDLSEYKKVQFPTEVDYPLWVDGVQVSSINMSDVLADDETNKGKVSFEPVTQTSPAILTLNGVNISKGYTYNDYVYGIRYTGSDPLNIVLEKDSENIIKKADGSFTVGVFSRGDNVDITISGEGTLDVSGTSGGLVSYGNVTIEEGDIITTGTADNGDGIRVSNGNNIIINGGKLIASGNNKALNGKVTNEIAGTGWTNTQGSEGETEIPISADSTLNYKRVQFPAVEYYPIWVAGVHVSKNNKDDVLGDGTVSFVPATESAPATLILDNADITEGFTDENGTYGIYYIGTEELKIELAADSDNKISNSNYYAGIYSNTADQGVTISGAGKLMVSTSLRNGTGIFVYNNIVINGSTVNVSVDGVYSDGILSKNNGTIKIKDSTVTLNASGAESDCFDAKNIDIINSSVNVYGENNGINNSSGDDGTVSIDANSKVTVVGGKNAINGLVINAVAGTGWMNKDGTGEKEEIEVSETARRLEKDYLKVQFPAESSKASQTITAEDITVSFDDTGVKVSATTSGDGKITYAVKDGYQEYIGIMTETGELSIIKVPSDGKAYITVTASETENYLSASKDVTITINKADPQYKAPEAKTNLKYNGSAQDLVTAGTATGGTMYYCIGIDQQTPTAFGTKIPSALDAGTYYVFYHVKGDENHNDTDVLGPITITIAKATGSVTSNNQKPVPIDGLKYSEEGVELLKAPEELPEGYTKVRYSMDNGKTWTDSIPKGQGGDYTIKVKYIGDKNHNDFEGDYETTVSVQNSYSANDTEWTKGSNFGDLIIYKAKVQDEQTYGKFVNVRVDDETDVLDPSNYDKGKGSVRITLKPAYLETLSVGEHTLTAYFLDGAVSTAKFIIKERSKPVTPSYIPPKTGD